MNRSFLFGYEKPVDPNLMKRVSSIKAQFKIGMYCLDLHSLSSPSEPFCICGLGRELDVKHLPVDKVVVFDSEFQKRVVGSFIAWAAHHGAGSALVLECGQHDEPGTRQLAYSSARNFLASLGVTSPDSQGVCSFPSKQFFKVIEFDSRPLLQEGESATFEFLRDRRGFEEVRASELLGKYTIRHRGEIRRYELRTAKHEGFLIMPAAGSNMSTEGGNYVIGVPYSP